MLFQELSSDVTIAPTCTYLWAITQFLQCLSPPKSSRANKKSTKSHITVSMFCKSCAERHYTHLVAPLPHAAPSHCRAPAGSSSSQEVSAGFLHEMRWESCVGAMPSFYSADNVTLESQTAIIHAWTKTLIRSLRFLSHKKMHSSLLIWPQKCFCLTSDGWLITAKRKVQWCVVICANVTWPKKYFLFFLLKSENASCVCIYADPED